MIKIRSFMIWGSFLATQALMIFASQTMMTMPGNGIHSDVPASLVAAHFPQEAFYLPALVVLAAAYFVPKYLREKLQAVSAVTPVNDDKVLVPSIIQWAMLECLTVIGFVCSALYADPAAIYPFAALSLIGFAFTVPKSIPNSGTNQ